MRRPLVPLAVAVLIAGCGGSGGTSSTRPSAPSTATSTAAAGAQSNGGSPVSGNVCPQVMDAERADFFPIQGSMSAGYSMSVQKLDDTTKDWAYVVSGDFPYSNWMAWYLYNEKGVPVYKFADAKIAPDSGSTNPFVDGKPILASKRGYHLYFMPATTPKSVLSQMQQQGKNVTVLPALGTTGAASLVSRSYWSLGNDGVGGYDRFGYGGRTSTPFPVVKAYLVDSSTGQLTNTPVGDCGSASLVPHRLWFDSQSGKPIIDFLHAPRPSTAAIARLPKLIEQTGAVDGVVGKEFPPSPVPDEVQFYRNNASETPYADVQSMPAKGDPPDACGGYVMANLPNRVVSLIHVPQVPSYPDYRGATSSTLNQSSQYDVQFYSMVSYGATKQADAYGQPTNSQVGNRQVLEQPDGSATIVLWPQSATQDDVKKIAAVVKANRWNILRSGLQTNVAPNLLVIREKGQNENWKNALSANDVTQGAPCAQSTNPSLPMPKDPSSAQVTQKNGMGLTAPSGENCSIASFLSGQCLTRLQTRMKQNGDKWSAQGGWPAQKAPSG